MTKLHTLVLTAALMVLTGCVGPLVEHIKIDQRNASYLLSQVPVVTPDDLKNKKYELVQPLSAISCKNKLWDPDPSNEDAINQLRVKAARSAANALTNMYCEAPKGTDLLTNCWSSIVCHAAAIRLLDKQYELFGYVRSPMGPGTETLDQSYTNSTYRWSISYPPNWTVDDKDPTSVRILSSADNALCGVHSSSVRFTTVDEFTDFMLDQTEQFLKQEGLVSMVSARHRISLPNNIVGNDVIVDLLPGGKSRRIFVLADGQGFDIDCETYANNWGKLDPSFDRIINSFTVEQ